MMNAITEPQARALAALIAALRLDWQTQGVLAALAKAQHLGTAFELAHAAIHAASEPSNRTPAVIAMAGAHWARAKATSTQTGGDNMPGLARCTEHPTERAHNCRSCTGDRIGKNPDNEPAASIPTQANTGMTTERIREIFHTQGVTR